MGRRGVTLPRKCENCANYAQRAMGKKEQRQVRREQRKGKTHTYQSTAQPVRVGASAVANTPPLNGNGQPQPSAPRTMEQMRAEEPRDVVTYLLKGAAIGLAGLGFCVPLAVWVKAVPWHSPFVVFFAAAGLGILLSVFNPREWLVNWVEDKLQRDIDGDGQKGTVGYVVDGKLDDGRGRQLYLNFKLEGRNAHQHWHNFCRAVVDGANFSETEATKRQGVTPADWKRIYEAFTAQQWLRPAGPRGTPELINEGPKWVRLYAEHPPTSDGSGVSGRLYGDR